MGKSSFFDQPVAYDVIQEGGEGSSFFGDGPAYTKIDPVAIQNFVAAAKASATASEVSNQASHGSADDSANSAATATTQAGIATTKAGVATTQAGVATTQAGISTTQAGNSATSAAASLASQNAAKTSETNAKTSETNSKTSETNSAASATSASGSATTATTQAGNSATSASQSLASKNAAATSETNAAASATAANTSKVNAGTSETNAAASATAANTSKVNAGTSETNALAYKNAAATSATNAATSETNSALSLTTFKAVWCGNSATDPTVNGNGGALTAGCLYWNTATGTLKIFSGSSWGAYSAVSVATVFGRSGAVTAQAGDYTFAQIGSKPTSIAGYGITDTLTNTVFGRAGAVTAQAGDYTFAQIGSKPTTLSGYGITDSLVKPAVATNFSAAQSFTLATLVDAANIAWDVNAGQKAKVTIAGARTMNAVTNAVEGTTYFLWVVQDGAGSRTLAWTATGAGSYDFGAAGAPTLTTTASRADLLCFEAVTIAGTLKLRFCGVQKGFS